jgi:hypothetical protein
MGVWLFGAGVLKIVDDFAIARALFPGRDSKGLLDAIRQEFSRSALTRAQIKKCAPIQERLVQKLEQCVATGDNECRFSKTEADDINRLSE